MNCNQKWLSSNQYRPLDLEILLMKRQWCKVFTPFWRCKYDKHVSMKVKLVVLKKMHEHLILKPYMIYNKIRNFKYMLLIFLYLRYIVCFIWPSLYKLLPFELFRTFARHVRDIRFLFESCVNWNTLFLSLVSDSEIMIVDCNITVKKSKDCICFKNFYAASVKLPTLNALLNLKYDNKMYSLYKKDLFMLFI